MNSLLVLSTREQSGATSNFGQVDAIIKEQKENTKTLCVRERMQAEAVSINKAQ